MFNCRSSPSVVQSAFFDELAELLDTVAMRAEPVYLVGDFNIRLDHANDPNTVNLTDLLGYYGFVNRVTAPTHRLGGMLDVVFTRQDLTAPDVEVVDVGLSEHSLLRWSASSARPTSAIETFFRQPWRSLDINDFRSVLSSSALCQPDRWHSLNPDKMASLYDTELAAILDRVIPARTVTRRRRTSDPWFDEECRTAKRLDMTSRTCSCCRGEKVGCYSRRQCQPGLANTTTGVSYLAQPEARCILVKHHRRQPVVSTAAVAFR